MGEEVIISVVACGPSALSSGPIRGSVIAVNDAYRHVEASRVISMDGRWATHRAADFMASGSPVLHLRRSAYNHIKDEFPEWRFQIFDCDIDSHDFPSGGTTRQLNGDHSGYCALALAYTLATRSGACIYLYGYDMREPTHFFGDYEWKGEGSTNSPGKFRRWAADMVHAKRQFDAAGIQVFNTNKSSAITAFPYGRPQ